MSDIFYTDLRDNTVDPVLNQFGFSMTIKSSRAPVLDPNTGAEVTPGAGVETAVVGIFRFYSQDEINGRDILASDIQCLVGGLELNTAGVIPDTSMQLIAKGDTYNIVRVTPTQPGGVSVLYRLQIRR